MTLPLPRFGNFVVITNVAPIALTAYWPAAAHRSRTKHVFHARPQPPENEEAIREQRTASTHASEATAARDLRLDLFRGIALWLIFLDHIPSNLVAWITIRNYGFSDATEIFVFVSGYTAAFVYGKEMRERGFLIAGAHILRRAWQIYVAHVFLFAIYLAEITYVATRFENPLYAEEMNILDFLKQPDVTIVQALLLKFKPHGRAAALHRFAAFVPPDTVAPAAAPNTGACSFDDTLRADLAFQLEPAELSERTLVFQPICLAASVRVRRMVRARGS